MDSAIKHITQAEAQQQASNEARRHVLTMLQELQQWISTGGNVQNFILIKTNLYTKSTS